MANTVQVLPAGRLRLASGANVTILRSTNGARATRGKARILLPLNIPKCIVTHKHVIDKGQGMVPQAVEHLIVSNGVGSIVHLIQEIQRHVG